jgi:hypothetical protein
LIRRVPRALIEGLARTGNIAATHDQRLFTGDSAMPVKIRRTPI